MVESIEYNGYTFDDTNSTIQAVFGNGLPNIRSSIELKAQQDGAVPTGYRYGERTFGWSGHVSDNTPANYLAERVLLMGALNMQNQPIEGSTMTFNLITGDTWTLRQVRLESSNFDFPEGEPSRTWNKYQVGFEATFPFYEGTETDETQQITAFDFGVVVAAPVAAPLTGTSVSSSSTDPLLLTNNGNANAYPSFTITGPGTTFTVSNSTTGHYFTINKTLAANETITVDSWDNTVTQGSAEIGVADFSGSFIYLQPGGNTLTFTAVSGTTSDTQLQTVFKDTYLGL